MLLHHEASSDFSNSLKAVDVLIAFAKSEDLKGNTDNRELFLKLSVVSMVTKFQVFIESILKEFTYRLKTSGVKYIHLPVHLILNSIRLHSEDFIIKDKLKNSDAYTSNKALSLQQHLIKLGVHFDNFDIDDSLAIADKFPIGKTGKTELIHLFRQIEGKNIFENASFDINVLDSILLKRHLVVHQDFNAELTEESIASYLDYLKSICVYVDLYLYNCLTSFQSTR